MVSVNSCRYYRLDKAYSVDNTHLLFLDICHYVMADEAASSKCSANNQAKFSLFGFLFLFFTDTYCVHVDSSPSIRILLFFFFFFNP